MQIKIMIACLLIAFASTGTAAQTADQSVSVKNPKAFAELLKELGYAPGDVKPVQGFPQLTVNIADQPSVITFGGCSLLEDCSYIVISSSFSDVKKPPPTWITKMNDSFDAIKVGLNDERHLYFSATHMIEGVPRSTLRQILETWGSNSSALAQEAVKAKLNKAE